MSNPTSNGQSTAVRIYPGTDGRGVDLVPDDTKFSVVFSTERSALSKEAQDVLRDRAAPVGQIAHYGVRIYEGPSTSARNSSVAVLNQERAVDLAAPVMHRHSPDGDEVYVTRYVLVQFWPEVDRPEIDALLEKLDATVVETLSYAANGFRLLANAESGGLGALALANALRDTGHTVFAHPDLISPRHRRTITQIPPTATTAEASPTMVPANPGLVHAERETRDGDYVAQQWHLAFARITDAWSLSRGSSSITVAILDDGVDITHPEVLGRVVAQWDFSAGTGDGTPKTADDKHGTACAGVAAAAGRRASGSAPECSLMAVRFPSTLGDSDEANMFRWAADNRADVISCSWGPADGTGQTDPLPGSTQAAIHYCLTNGRGGKGIPIVWAAGNGNESVDLDGYASNADVMAIAAMNDHSTRSWYSDQGNAIWVCAPSSGDRDAGERAITTIDRQGAAGYNNGSEGLDANYTNSFGGTSSATPLVAGIIGLMLSANPDLTADEVRTMLRDSARQVGSGYDGSGHSPEYGYGLVDAYEAVRHAQAATGQVTPAPGRPSIIGPSTISRADSTPGFEVDPGGGAATYYAVEVATRSDLLDGGDHTTDDGFYASWQDTAFLAANPYTLPDAVWQRMRTADNLYYRAWFSSNATAWENTIVTTEDANFAQAPSISISDGETRSRDTKATPQRRDNPPATHAGFDRLQYPGDDAMRDLWAHTNLAWTGFYLAPAPSQGYTGWMDKAQFLRDMGWGLAPIYVGQQWTGGPGSHTLTAAQGTTDASNAVQLADTAGIGSDSVIYLDIEIGGRLPQSYLDYVNAWFAGIRQSTYRPGTYCSFLDTPTQLRAANPDVVFWVFNINHFTSSQFLDTDGSFRAPAVGGSGCDFAVAWQFIQGASGVRIPHDDGTSTPMSPFDFDTATVLDPSHPNAAATSSGGDTTGSGAGSGQNSTPANSGSLPTIIGPATLSRTASAPQFDLTPADGSNATYYAVEVATDSALFDDASHSLEDGFYGSWTDTPFLSSNPYTLPDAIWQTLGSSVSALYYRAWFSASSNDWVDTVVTLPASASSSAPSITITDNPSPDTRAPQRHDAPLKLGTRHPEVSAPATAVRGGEAPIFDVDLPAGAKSWWLEVTSEPLTFSLDGSARRSTENFWNSETFDPALRHVAMTVDGWTALQPADRLFYRVCVSTTGVGGVRYLQDSSTSPLLPDAAPWIDIVAADDRSRNVGAGQISNPDELRWRERSGQYRAVRPAVAVPSRVRQK